MNVLDILGDMQQCSGVPDVLLLPCILISINKFFINTTILFRSNFIMRVICLIALPQTTITLVKQVVVYTVLLS